MRIFDRFKRKDSGEPKRRVVDPSMNTLLQFEKTIDYWDREQARIALAIVAQMPQAAPLGL